MRNPPQSEVRFNFPPNSSLGDIDGIIRKAGYKVVKDEPTLANTTLPVAEIVDAETFLFSSPDGKNCMLVSRYSTIEAMRKAGYTVMSACKS